MDLAGITVDNRYRVAELLGEGGMSFVFKAFDTHSNTNVAIKFMKDGVTSAYTEDRIRFKREIALVSKLNHPSVTRVFGTGEYENRPYVIMELLDGESLSSILSRSPVFSPDESTAIIERLAEALDYVHTEGVIHRDIKPANIFINRKPNKINVSLLDFGISLIMELGEMGRLGNIIGTFGYMSPEAAGLLNKQTDERSDLYSLGVVFYNLLTGTPPFMDKEIGKLLHHQAAIMPVRPSKIKAGIPDILDNIVMKLLMKDPDMRYQSAGGLLYDIRRFNRGERDFIVGDKDQKVKLAYHTKLVGRENVMKRITGLVENAGAGNGGVCLVGGEPGIGKSRLAEELRTYSREREYLFLTGRCLNHEKKSPFQPFRDVTDEYIRRVEKSQKNIMEVELARVRQSAGELGEILLRFNPGMRDLLGETKKLVPLEPERETARFMNALSDFFLSLGSIKRPCIIYLDDLQWADEGSLQLLRELAQRIGDSNLLILGPSRDNELCEGAGLKKLIEEMNRAKAAYESIRLEAFGMEEMKTLLSYLLGNSKDSVENLAAYILDKSGGNPLYSISVLRELVESKAIVWENGYWKENPEKIRSVTIRGSMVDVIISRIERLDEIQRDVLCKGALIGREFDLELLYRLVPFGRDKVVYAADRAVDMQLLERGTGRGRLMFTHDRIRDAFLGKLASNEKRAIHQNIGDEIESIYAADHDRILFDLVHHYSEAGNEEKLLKYSVLAGEKAALSYANEEAISYYLTAASLYEKSGQKGSDNWVSVCQSLIELYLTTGQNDEAINLSQTILPYIADNLSKAQVYKKIGTAYFKKGDWKNTDKHLTLVLELLDEKLPKNRINLIISVFRELLRHFFHIAFPSLFNYRNNSRIRKKDLVIANTLHFLSWTYILSDLARFIYTEIRNFNISCARLDDCHEKMMAVAGYASLCSAIPLFRKRGLKYHNICLDARRRINDTWGMAQSYQQMGFTCSWDGDNSASYENFNNSGRILSKIGDLWELGQAYHGMGLACYYLSDYKQACSYFNKYLQLSEKLNDYYGISAALTGIGVCMTETGRISDAESYFYRARKESREHNILFMYCYSCIYSGVWELERGNHDAAIGYFEQARILHEKNYFLGNYIVLLYPLLAAAHEKKLEQDRKNMDSSGFKTEMRKIRSLCKDAMHQASSYPNHYSAALLSTAAYHSLAGHYKTAERLYLKSISHANITGRKFEEARSHYYLGDFLNMQGRYQEAVEQWSRAYEIFNEIDAAKYADLCYGLLEAEGLKPSEPLRTTAGGRLKYERRMCAVMETSRYISSILETDKLLEKIMDSTMELLGASRGILYLYSGDGNSVLERRVVRNNSNEPDEDFSISRSVISMVEKNRSSLLIADASAHEELASRSTVMLAGIKSVICAPIKAKGEMLGVIYLDNNLVSGLFSEEDLQILELISTQAAVSIENARLYGKLMRYSQELEDSRNEILQWNLTLEQRVNERTEELNKTMAQLIMTQDELVKTSNMAVMANLMARIAHEINTPIGNSLTAASHLLHKTEEIERQFAQGEMTKSDLARYLDKSLEAGKLTLFNLKRAAELIRSFKLISSDQASGVKREFRVKEYIEDILQGMLPEISKSKHNIIVRCDNDLKVCSYPGAFSQIITNLVNNSLTHAFEENADGEICITVTGNEGLLRLIYHDNGKGIDSSIIDRIFEPFFTTSSDRGGTGLGLNIVYNIVVKSLMGKINCESEPGKGTTFNVEIPLM
jgi:predicted ATPase/signal transduction histidine kinase